MANDDNNLFLYIILASSVTAKLFKLPVYQRSKRISIYISMAGEIETHSIIEDILATGN
jgi:5-formyltetrahydrofolate cyclo-ligase